MWHTLANVTVVGLVKRLVQGWGTVLGGVRETYRRRGEAFGARAIVIDGHEMGQIDSALEQARRAVDRPTVILARTIKGKGFSEIENLNGWHGKALPEEMAIRAIAELGGVRSLRVNTRKPPAAEPVRAKVSGKVTLPVYELGHKIATRQAYGDALLALGNHPGVVAMDAEVSNSTFADEFAKHYPDRFFEMYIAEEMMVSVAVGMAVRGYIPFASTFAAFFSRAYDFIRMAGISRMNIRLVGSHCGVEIGQDGPSQMALEDLAALRAVHGSIVLYPCDATSAAKLTALMADTSGIVYLRTTRGAYPVLYLPSEDFRVGGSKVLRRSDRDSVTLIGGGVTVHACLAAADQLATEGVSARVIDLYSVKPVDVRTLREACRDTRGLFVVAEDHYPEGGVAAAILEALTEDAQRPSLAHCAVRDLPGSGTPSELLDLAGISADQLVDAAMRLAEGTEAATDAVVR